MKIKKKNTNKSYMIAYERHWPLRSILHTYKLKTNTRKKTSVLKAAKIYKNKKQYSEKYN